MKEVLGLGQAISDFPWEEKLSGDSLNPRCGKNNPSQVSSYLLYIW